MTKQVMRVPTPPPLVTSGESLSQTLRKPKPLPTISRLFKPVTNPSVPAVEMVDVALWPYFLTHASEKKLTSPGKVQEAIRSLKLSKAPGPNGIPNRALKHLKQRAISFWLLFNAILLTHHFPSVWKHCPHPIGPLVSLTRLANFLK
jgi:hypothetical protein